MARRYRSALSDPAAARWLLIAVTLGFLGVFLLLPLVIIVCSCRRFCRASAHTGAPLADADTRAAIRLTLL